MALIIATFCESNLVHYTTSPCGERSKSAPCIHFSGVGHADIQSYPLISGGCTSIFGLLRKPL